MSAWLARHCSRNPPDELPAFFGEIRWPTEKPAAMISIDDRALTFDGTWPALDTLKTFKPWNKR